MGHTLGLVRATYLVALCCIGSFLFSYDTGIIGGILTLKAFENDFGYSKANATKVNSNAVSVLQAGAFFGCIFIWPITARFGRRWSIILSSFIFCIGAILQVINTHSLPCFYVGRVISGLGVGAATVLIPMFSAEMAPKSIRGRLGSFFQLFFAAGVCVSYWVDYAVEKGIPSSTKQWQVPIGLQLVPGGLLGLGMFLIPESVRWLAKRGRNEEALRNLIWVRGGDDDLAVREEFAEIQAGIEEEIRATEGLTMKELMLPSIRYRLFIAFTMQMCQQFTGNTSLAYYAPQIFASVGAGQSALLISGFFGVIKVVSVATFLLFLVERVGRRWSFIFGAFAMGSFMLIIACIDATHPAHGTGNPTPSAIASVIMIYFEAASFNLSWGPLAWLYLGEIFPNRIREPGIALGAATQWLFNFVFSQITPHALANIGWKTFLMFCVFNYAIVVYAWFFLKETKGKSLEEMEEVFGSKETTFDYEAARASAANKDQIIQEESEVAK